MAAFDSGQVFRYLRPKGFVEIAAFLASRKFHSHSFRKLNNNGQLDVLLVFGTSFACLDNMRRRMAGGSKELIFIRNFVLIKNGTG